MIILSIIIIQYKSKNLLINCLNSAKSYKSFYNFEWIVIDNESNHDTKDLIIKLFPNILWYEMGYNAGFSRANNYGIKIASGDIILFLNPDTIILDNCIENCLNKFINSNLLSCSVQQLYLNRSLQPTGGFFNKFCIKRNNKIGLINERLQYFDFLYGAFIMIKKADLRNFGNFDNDFFLYYEEIELFSRLYKHGKIAVFKDLHITHIGNHGKKLSILTRTQLSLSNLIRIRKQYGFLFFLFKYFLFNVKYKLLKLFLNSNNNNFHYSKKYYLNLNKYIYQIFKKIIFNKPFLYKITFD